MLNVSWRSGQDVIDTVNRIFGRESVLRAAERQTATLRIHTDIRSPKVEHLRLQPACTITSC